jgi:hypothetical protein
MKKIILLMTLFCGIVFYCSEAKAQDDGGGKKSKKSKKAKGMGTQEDLDQEMKDGKERGMSKEDKKNVAKKKKEVAAKRKRDEVTRKNADKVGRKRLNKTLKGASKKKKRWVKTH